MSYEVSVFLDPMRMLSPKAWAEAVSVNGFDMQMDADFNPRESCGFLSCVYRGEPAGFEYGYELLDPATGSGQGIGDPCRRVRVTLGPRSKHPEYAASVVAGGVLCAIADGILRDPDTGELIRSAEAIAWARRQEAQWATKTVRRDSDADADAAAAGPAPAEVAPRPEGLPARTSREAAQDDPTWRTVCLNLAVAYAVAIILTTYLSPPNELAVLMLGPLLLVAVSGLFGLAVVAVVRLRKILERRLRPRLVWLVSTWIALVLSLVDPFLPTPSIQTERTQESAIESGPGVLGDRGRRKLH
jgi:hypothetical protein